MRGLVDVLGCSMGGEDLHKAMLVAVPVVIVGRSDQAVLARDSKRDPAFWNMPPEWFWDRLKLPQLAPSQRRHPWDRGRGRGYGRRRKGRRGGLG